MKDNTELKQALEVVIADFVDDGGPMKSYVLHESHPGILVYVSRLQADKPNEQETR